MCAVALFAVFSSGLEACSFEIRDCPTLCTLQHQEMPDPSVHKTHSDSSYHVDLHITLVMQGWVVVPVHRKGVQLKCQASCT